MICTSVVPCLSSGFAKINKIMIQVCPIFPGFFAILNVQLFFKKKTSHKSSQTGCWWSIFKSTTIKSIFLKNVRLLLCFCESTVAFWNIF